MRLGCTFAAVLLWSFAVGARAEGKDMTPAVLYVDDADPTWFSGYPTVKIEVDVDEHVFRRAVLGNEARGVFATYNGRRILLLRKSSEAFMWEPPGCAVAIVVPKGGNWPQNETDLEAVPLEDVGKAVVEIEKGSDAPPTT